MKAIDLFEGSEHYTKFIDSFVKFNDSGMAFEDKEISIAIYYHLYKIRYAHWNMKVNFGRKVDHETSGLLQDMIAFYLKVSLNNDYKVILEEKKEKLRPDIIIIYNDKPYFIIEIKTTIGWNRQGLELFPKRIEEMAKTFQIKQENVIYIFESPVNVSDEFTNEFWDNKTNSPKKSKIYPYIYPLYYKEGPSPYWWKYYPSFDKDKEIKETPKDLVIEIAKKNIITDFNEILSLIQAR